MKVFLLQDQTELSDRLKFMFENAFGGEVFLASTMTQALDILSLGARKSSRPAPVFDLIIHDLQKASPEEFQSLLASNPSVPVIICTSENAKEAKSLAIPDLNVVGGLPRGQLAENLIPTIEDLINKGTLPKPPTDEKFCRIRTKLLLSVCPLKSDVFIKLSDWKYVKLFHAGDAFEASDMEKYTVKKGVEYLYLRKEESAEFISKYAEELKKLLHVDNLSVEAVSRASETAHETVRELGKRLGFNSAVQEIAKTQIQMTMKAIGKSPRLSDIIQKMQNKRGEYIASHSTMCAYLACSIASQMKWGSDLTFYKLNLAAFLHDITLDNQELATFNSYSDALSSGKFTDAELENYKNHTIKGAQSAQQFKEVPPDVDTIIAQHHERPDGSGFPRKLTGSYIAPLSAVFIVAHDLATYTLAKGPYFNMDEFILLSGENYKTSQFKKVLQAMQTL